MKAISTIARFFRQNGEGEQTQAKDIMSTPVLTISPDATVGEAAGLMLEKHVSCLPVVDEQEQLVGMLAHSDFELHRKLIGMVDDLYELLVLQRQFREGCGVMPAWRRGAWHGSVWPVRYCPAYPQATAATRLARTVPGAAFPAPPGRPAAS